MLEDVDKKIIIPKKFNGQYCEDYIEEMKRINPIYYEKSIYSKMENYIMSLIHKTFNLPYKPREEAKVEEQEDITQENMEIIEKK